MNYLDLFSGIGGFHKGLEEAGFKFEWSGHSEIDKYAKSIYQDHFKESEDLGNVTNINVSDLPRAKKWIVTGGWPCQDNSIAGKRKGQRGYTRSGLLSQIIRLIGELIEMGAEVTFIGENVKGLYSVNDGVDFLDSITGLTYLDKDSPQLTLEMQLLNTRWFLPQNRERVYFVGRSGKRSGQQIFPIGKSGGVLEPKKRRKQRREVVTTVRAGMSGIPGNSETYVKVERAAIKFPGRNGKKFNDDYAFTIDSMNNDDYAFTIDSMNNGGVKIEQHYSISCNCGNVFEGPISDKCPSCGEIQSGYAREDGSGQPTIKITQRGRGFNKGGEQDICPTISTSSFEHNNHVSGVRRFTPLECERLQGFPDDWTKYGKDGELISDTQRYKCTGNAVSVPVVKAVGERL